MVSDYLGYCSRPLFEHLKTMVRHFGELFHCVKQNEMYQSFGLF
jgi:hypothetical protein